MAWNNYVETMHRMRLCVARISMLSCRCFNQHYQSASISVSSPETHMLIF